jgi:hypothetical protein
VQHLAVPHTLRKETLRGGERDTVGAAQQPAAVLLPVVGQALTGVPQHLREQLSEWHVLRQRDIDAPLRRADRHPGQPNRHCRISHRDRYVFSRIQGGGWGGRKEEAAELRGLYLP